VFVEGAVQWDTYEHVQKNEGGGKGISAAMRAAAAGAALGRRPLLKKADGHMSHGVLSSSSLRLLSPGATAFQFRKHPRRRTPWTLMLWFCDRTGNRLGIVQNQKTSEKD